MNFLSLADVLDTIAAYEKTFTPFKGVKFANDNFQIPVAVCVIYLLGCYYGQKLMKNRKPFELKYSLAAWNGFLSLFSFVGMIKTAPRLYENISKSFVSSICDYAPSSYGISTDNFWIKGSGPCGLWVFLFIYSKLPELIDTLFIVLKKKPLIFLHWYHHVSVLLYCWHAYATMAATGLYFVAMNYTVIIIKYLTA